MLKIINQHKLIQEHNYYESDYGQKCKRLMAGSVAN